MSQVPNWRRRNSVTDKPKKATKATPAEKKNVKPASKAAEKPAAKKTAAAAKPAVKKPPAKPAATKAELRRRRRRRALAAAKPAAAKKTQTKAEKAPKPAAKKAPAAKAAKPAAKTAEKAGREDRSPKPASKAKTKAADVIAIADLGPELALEEIKVLVKMGRSKGNLTDEEIQGALSDVELSDNQVERVYTFFKDSGIEIVEDPSHVIDADEVADTVAEAEGVEVLEPAAESRRGPDRRRDGRRRDRAAQGRPQGHQEEGEEARDRPQ